MDITQTPQFGLSPVALHDEGDAQAVCAEQDVESARDDRERLEKRMHLLYLAVWGVGRENGATDQFRKKGDYGVAAAANSVHPIGNPISHSWRLGFVREGIYVPRRSADLRELLPPAFDTPDLRGVGKKGRDPKSIADMGGAKVGSLDAMPDRIVPERGQVSEHPGEPSATGSRKEFWNVLHDRDGGSKLANKTGVFAPETGTLAINARSRASFGQVLTGKTPADDVNGNSIGSKSLAAEVSNVMVARNLRPVLGKDAARELFDFAERDGLETAGAFQPEREAADAAEQVKDPQFRHLPLLAVWGVGRALGGRSEAEMRRDRALLEKGGHARQFGKKRATLGFGERAHSGHRLEEIALALRILDAAAGDVEVSFAALDADERSLQIVAGDTSCPAAHEWINDRGSIGRKVADCPLHDAYRLLSRVVAPIPLSRLAAHLTFANEAVPSPFYAPNCFRQIGPRQLAISEVVGTILFVPNKPAASGWKRIVVAAEEDVPATGGTNRSDEVSADRFVIPIIVTVIGRFGEITARSVCPSSFADAVRPVGHDRIDLLQRRQHFPRIPQIQGSIPDDLDAAHLPASPRWGRGVVVGSYPSSEMRRADRIAVGVSYRTAFAK